MSPVAMTLGRVTASDMAHMDEGSIPSELCTHSSQSFFFVQAKLLALSASACHQVIAQDWSCFRSLDAF